MFARNAQASDDYVGPLTYRLLLKMADERIKPPYKQPSIVPDKYNKPSLIKALKEAITNAVIHRDYYIKRDIEVRVFEDRVEIESPGLFPLILHRLILALFAQKGTGMTLW